MEERLEALEKDYETFIKDISAHQKEHTTMLRTVTQDTRDTKLRAAAIESRINTLDRRVELMGDRLRMMDTRVDAIDGRLNIVDSRLNNLEQQMGEMREDVKQILALLTKDTAPEE